MGISSPLSVRIRKKYRLVAYFLLVLIGASILSVMLRGADESMAQESNKSWQEKNRDWQEKRQRLEEQKLEEIKLEVQILEDIKLKEQKQKKKNRECWKSRQLSEPDVLKFRAEEALYSIPEEEDGYPIDMPPRIPKEFIIEEKDFCAKRKDLKIIVPVHSAMDYEEERNFIRNTWGNQDKTVGVVFMIGKSKNRTQMNKIKKESELFHDIVQGNYTDLYKLLLYKTLNALYWTTINCANVPWVFRADDDIFIGIRGLIGFTHSLEEANKVGAKTFYGSVFINDRNYKKGVDDLRVKNTVYEKWLTTIEEYPCIINPPFCLGPGWLTSSSNIQPLLNGSQKVKFFFIEDIYLTGHVGLLLGMEHKPISKRPFKRISVEEKNNLKRELAKHGNKTNIPAWEDGNFLLLMARD